MNHAYASCILEFLHFFQQKSCIVRVKNRFAPLSEKIINRENPIILKLDQLIGDRQDAFVEAL